MTEEKDAREDESERVADAVRHALQIVGPPERGMESLSDISLGTR